VSDTNSGLTHRWTMPGRRGWTALAVVAVLVAGFFAVRSLGGAAPTSPAASRSPEEVWRDRIISFGIEPVYPPEEDLVVGDVLAVVVRDADPDPITQATNVAKQAFISRSVKLAHIDATPQLDEAYKNLPVFPATGVLPPLTALRDGIKRQFSDAVLLGNLPRAVLPRQKTEGAKNAAAGTAAEGTGSANYAAGSQEVDQFELADVRTYGLASVAALALFENYCKHDTMSVCREATARKHLERVVGPAINRKYLARSGEFRYALEIELEMVYRVYLTGSIVDLRRTTSNQKGGLMAWWPFGSGQSSTPAVAVAVPTGMPTPASGDAADQIRVLSGQLAEIQQKLDKAKAGAGMIYQASSGNESALEGKFDRPIAIGYRSVTVGFVPDDPPPPPPPATAAAEPPAAPPLAPPPPPKQQ
jgi:hypothetical protein